MVRRLLVNATLAIWAVLAGGCAADPLAGVPVPPAVGVDDPLAGVPVPACDGAPMVAVGGMCPLAPIPVGPGGRVGNRVEALRAMACPVAPVHPNTASRPAVGIQPDRVVASCNDGVGGEVVVGWMSSVASEQAGRLLDQRRVTCRLDRVVAVEGLRVTAAGRLTYDADCGGEACDYRAPECGGGALAGTAGGARCEG